MNRITLALVALVALVGCTRPSEQRAPVAMPTPAARPYTRTTIPMPAMQFRIARPTDRLDEVVRFYHDGLGLPVLGSFAGHAGYDGVMVGLPDAQHHLEFTRHADGSPGPTPSAENLLVLYFDDRTSRDAVVARLESMGYHPVPPENPYWLGKAITIPDPDGWRVVLFDGRYAPKGG